MEIILEKHQQKLRKVQEKMEVWDEYQHRLITDFTDASNIIQRLEVIGDKRNFGSLRGGDGIEDAVLRGQMESLKNILLSIEKTMEEFHGIVQFLDKMVRDSKQQVRGGSHNLSTKQRQQRIGIKPSVSDCLDGLAFLREMHNSEYLLKTLVISALTKIALKPSSSDLGALRQLLVDQPSIPKDEVNFIFEMIFAEDIS